MLFYFWFAYLLIQLLCSFIFQSENEEASDQEHRNIELFEDESEVITLAVGDCEDNINILNDFKQSAALDENVMVVSLKSFLYFSSLFIYLFFFLIFPFSFLFLCSICIWFCSFRALTIKVQSRLPRNVSMCRLKPIFNQ